MKHYSRKFRFVSSSMIAILLATSVGSCANNGPRTNAKGEVVQETPCDRLENAAIWGTVGALAGLAIGVALRDKRIMLGGLLAGGAIGAAVGKDRDDRACKAYKIAQKAGVQIQQDTVYVTLPAQPATGTKGSAAAQQEKVPVAQVSRWQDAAFVSGSASLTPQAQIYFMEVAKSYRPVPPDDFQLKTLTGNDLKDYRDGLAARNAIPLLLVGNTDDVGNSKANQELSEARAKAVGELFRQAGIDPTRIYYWGAGEGYPVADNRTEEGRALNRRVDILEFQDTEVLMAYLQSVRPNKQFYRPSERQVVAASAAQPTAASPSGRSGNQKSTGNTQPATITHAANANPFGAGMPPPASPSVAPSSPPTASTTSNDAATATASALPVPTAKARKPAAEEVGLIDFGGSAVPPTIPSLIEHAGGMKEPALSFSFVSSAFAAQPPTASCLDDRVRYSGDVKNLATSESVSSHHSGDFIPGMNNVPWEDVINDNLVLVGDLAVLRDGSRSIHDPQIRIYPAWSHEADKKKAHAKFTFDTVVSTYEAKNGVLLRVFTRDQTPVLSCVDILVPYAGVRASEGRLYYSRNSQQLLANYAPAVIR